MKFARTQLACAALAVLGASVIAGCGSDVPSGSVAKVGDATIKKADFDKWLKSAAQGSAQGGAASVPDPPNYSKCVAAKSAQPAPQGTKKPDAAALKKQCRQEYNQLKGDVMQFLIQAQWVQQESASRGVKVSDQEVTNRLAEEKKRAFPGKGIVIIEQATGLGQLVGRRFDFFAPFYKLVDVEGAPARIFAVMHD